MRATLAYLFIAVSLAGCGAATSAAARPGSAMVAGRVLAVPGCPVERANSPCPAIPVTGARIRALRGGHVIAATRSSRGGAFQLRLDPGKYVLIAVNAGGYRSTARAIITIRPGQHLKVTLTVDSGIR